MIKCISLGFDVALAYRCQGILIGLWLVLGNLHPTNIIYAGYNSWNPGPPPPSLAIRLEATEAIRIHEFAEIALAGVE